MNKSFLDKYKEGISPYLGGLNAQVVLVICMLGMIFYQGIRQPIVDPDIWWHLRAGQIILEKGIPSTDTFSFTTNQNPWLAYSWLAELIFYGVDKYTGCQGLILLQALLITLTCIFAYLTIYRETRSLRLAVILTTLAFYASPSWTLRPQLFSFLFAAIFVFLLRVEAKKHPSLLWLLPLLIMIWANCHVYFVIGLVLLTFFSLETLLVKDKGEVPLPFRRRKTILLINILCLLTPLINPYLYHLYIHIFNLCLHASSGWAATWIEELQSPNFHIWPMRLFEFMVMLSILAFTLSRKKPNVVTIILFIGLLHQALSHSRDITYFTIIVSIMLGYHLAHIDHSTWQRFIHPAAYRAGIFKSPGPFFLGLNVSLILGLLIFIASKTILLINSPTLVSSKEFPVQAVEFIKSAGLPGHMFNHFNWGGYLIYHLYPDYQVFIDGRTQVYPGKVADDYLSITLIQSGWGSLLAKYKVQWVIWPPKDPLATMLLGSSDWQKVYEDSTTLIFARRNGQAITRSFSGPRG